MAALANAEQPKIAQHPPAPVTGACVVALDKSGFQFFGLPTDGHRWLGDLQDEWKTHFHEASDDGVLKGAPHTVYEVREDDTVFMGLSIPPLKVIEYIVAHMLSKGWVLRMLFPTVQEARNAVTTKEYKLDALAIKSVQALLLDFTLKVRNMHVINHICGARESSREDIISCAIRETKEELGVDITADELTFVGYSVPHKSRKTGLDSCTAIFYVKFDKEELIEMFDQAMHQKHLISNWQCVHAWYKHIKDIDLKAAKALKANYEILSALAGAKWYPLNVQDTMDYKTKVMTMRFIDLTTPLAPPDAPGMQRLPCWPDEEEGASAKRSAPPTLTRSASMAPPKKKPRDSLLMPIIVLAEPHPDSLRRLQSFR